MDPHDRRNWITFRPPPKAQLLQRSFGEDILVCGKCGGRRRVLAYITEPSVVRAILQHLHLPSTARPPSSNIA